MSPHFSTLRNIILNALSNLELALLLLVVDTNIIFGCTLSGSSSPILTHPCQVYQESYNLSWIHHLTLAHELDADIVMEAVI